MYNSNSARRAVQVIKTTISRNCDKNINKEKRERVDDHVAKTINIKETSYRRFKTQRFQRRFI